MILVVDIGNSNICIGGYEGEKLLFKSRMKTDIMQMPDEYAIKIKSLVSLHGYENCDITGAIISSVVPPLIANFKQAVKLAMNNTGSEKAKILTVGPGIKTGLNIKTDSPSQLGTDLVCSAAIAVDKYKLPCIIFDMGTATTVTVIDENKNLLGCAIMPGVKIGYEALGNRASQLPQIEFSGKAPDLIGKNTVAAMKAGAVYGSAGMLDGMINRYKKLLGEDLTVITTGGLAKNIIIHCENDIIYDEDMILEGLRKIYFNNVKVKK